MIFTKEQIKRLPGSTVRLADGRTGYIAAPITYHMWFVEFQMRGGRKALANTNKSTALSSIDIVEVLEWADEKSPIHSPIISPRKDYHYLDCLSSAKCAADVPDIDRHWQSWLTAYDATYTLEQLRDQHARIVEQLAREIYRQHVAKMKKAARLGVK